MLLERTQETQPVRRGEILLLCALAVLFLAQVLTTFSTRCVEDEPWVSVPAYTLIAEGRLMNPVMDLPIDGKTPTLLRPPLLQLILAGVYRIAGVGIVQSRAVVAVFGLGTLILCYFTARVLYGITVAGVATLFLSVDNLHFLASRTFRVEAPVTFFGLLCFFLVILGATEKKAWCFFAAGLAGAAAMSTHPHGLLPVSATAIVILFHFGWRAVTKKETYLFLSGGILGALPYLSWVIAQDYANDFALFKAQILSRAPSGPGWLLNSIRREFARRYADYVMFPLRFHIALIVVGSVVFAWVRRKSADLILGFVVVWHLVLLILLLTMNKNVRYLALLSPYIVILVAAILFSLAGRELSVNLVFQAAKGRSFRVLCAAALILVFAGSQFVGNAYYLYQHRDTKYSDFAKRLREVVPRGTRVLGIITFWYPFHDQPYYSWQEGSFTEITTVLQPDIYILDDRVMLQGGDPGSQWEGEYDKLRQQLHGYVQKNGVLLGEVPNWFYGQVKVYDVRQPCERDSG